MNPERQVLHGISIPTAQSKLLSVLNALTVQQKKLK